MAVNLNEIKTGYISRNEICTRYHLSDTSISKYQATFDDFPDAEIQRVKFCQKPIQIFKTADIDNWVKKHGTALGIKIGFDNYLSRQFITGQFA